MSCQLSHPHIYDPRIRDQAAGYPTYRGHQKVVATKCWHEIHPASSGHTPWCPKCAESHTRAKLDAAQRNIVAEGGLAPAVCTRDRPWNMARVRHEIAKQRLERERERDQLRWEREQAWDEAHRQYDFERLPTVADYGDRAECPLCATIANEQAADIPNVRSDIDLPWWECPGALVMEQGVMPQTPPPSRNRRRKPENQHERSEALRQIIRSVRETMLAANSCRRVWEERHRTELAIRRKYGLGEDFQIHPDFWGSPLSGYASLRKHQQAREAQRMAERRARGNTTRPRPPRSPLSYSETAESCNVDLAWIEAQHQEEEQARLEREAIKVAEEVGYLYFVGAIDGMAAWQDDFMRSDRTLVVRAQVLNSETSGSEDSEDYDDGAGSAEDVEMMDIDGP